MERLLSIYRLLNGWKHRRDDSGHRANLAPTTNNTLIVPGYGPVGGRNELVEFHEMLLDVREKVAVLKRAGRSLGEAVAARPTAAYDATWGRFLVTPVEFVGLVYQGV